MSEDDLARLRAALEAATPAPDPGVRSGQLQRAAAAFASTPSTCACSFIPSV